MTKRTNNLQPSTDASRATDASGATSGNLSNSTRTSRSSRPGTSKGASSDRGNGAGSALAAALDLSDGTASVVVLQGDDGGTAAWASFLPHVLAGQTAVRILRQQLGESSAELNRRVRARIDDADSKTQRLLWVTPPGAGPKAIDSLRVVLGGYCRSERDVLLVSGANVMLIAAEPHVATGAVSDTTFQNTSAAIPAHAGARDHSPRGGTRRAPAADRAELRDRAPENSEVRWDAPEAGEAEHNSAEDPGSQTG